MKIVFFDGYCNLCNRLINQLFKLDKNRVLKFASLQGETAKRFHLNPPPNVDPSTLVYLREGERFEGSNAILMIFSDIGGIGKLSKAFWMIPKFLRDSAYAMTAKNRYRVFGKQNTCRLPTESERNYFLP